MNEVETLNKLGFIEAGEWIIGTNKSGLDLRLNKFNKEKHILYAFISNENIYYLGKTDRSLESRMNGYKNAGGTQLTNIRVRDAIIELLRNEKPVKILVLIDNFNYNHLGVKIRLAAGIEDNLIGILNPINNLRSKKINLIQENNTVNKVKKHLKNNEPLEIDEADTNSFRISTNEVKNGRINFPKKLIDYSLLPEFGTKVTVYIGKASNESFQATMIDSGGGNARINNALLKKWHEDESLESQDSFTIDIINKNTFRIRK